jgi:hypothetical protein
MKILAFLFIVVLAHQASAQKPIFIRVYDLKGNKISKGRVAAVTDTSLQLKENPAIIPVNTIGSVRTKHSAGNNTLIGSVIGASTMAILGAASGGSDSYYNSSAGAAAGALVGLPIGAAVGGITVLFKNSKTYLINGDSTRWKEFRAATREGNN